MNEVTVVITSCNRTKLLKHTFDSFIKNNTYPIEKYIIIEDSGYNFINDFLIDSYPNLNIVTLYNLPKKGQHASIDKAYSFVETEYIFHCEEDWEFYRSGFIEYSLKVLQSNDKIFQCWLREDNDTNHHPIEEKIYHFDDISYRLMSNKYSKDWFGFTFNPTLIRLKDYKILQPYAKYQRESNISIKCNNLGYRSAKSMIGYLKHIGWSQSTYKKTKQKQIKYI